MLVLRTFSKIFGLAGLRVGYGIGPADVITAIGKVRRAFDVTSAGQEAALASLDEEAEIARRRKREQGGDGAPRETCCASTGSSRPARRSRTSSSCASGDADALNDALLRRGVIVRPMRAFGAPDALRITAGTPEEVAFLGEALAALDMPIGPSRLEARLRLRAAS